MCSDAANGEYEDFDIKNEVGASCEGEATSSESRRHLNDILEMLISLDQQEIFMNPVDNSIAPDYSKVIANPMCFLKMRKKIQAGQYRSWMSFVEDFECICHNAMKYNQKSSKIWNAANMLLRKGKSCLEQQSSRYGKILGINKLHSSSYLQGVSAKRRLNVTCEGTQLDAVSKNLYDKASNFTSAQNIVSGICVEQSPTTSGRHQILHELVVREHSAVSLISKPLIKSSDEDVNVEILTLETEENARIDHDNQATECSSSFSGIQSEGEDCEEQLEIRNGNGARTAMEDTTATSRRRKKPMDADWKVYRQGIEWRCRWLELRVKELLAEAKKYKRVFEAAETRKQLHYFQDSTMARTSVMRLDQRIHVLRRKRRRMVEESCDFEAIMIKHPLFSRYEKKKHRNQEFSSTEEGARDDKQHILEFDDLSFDFDNAYKDNIVVEEDSAEHHLWQIEALQMHIIGLQNRLSGRPNVQEFNNDTRVSAWGSPPNFGGITPPVLSLSGFSNRPAVRESKGQGATPSLRRRNSDFDINNVVMPDSVMAAYVEPARHVFITTPHWQKRESTAAEDEEGSSEENTDDEIYDARHARMQMQERQQQYTPLSLNKSRSVSLAKERPKMDVAKRGLAIDSRNKEEFDDDHLTDFGSVPKRKRRKRESRDVASSVVDGQSMVNTLQGENTKGRTRSSSRISKT